MKIGLFGGTFDPIHIGHLVLAETVCNDVGLDQIVFILSGNPPHKNQQYLSHSQLRLDMVKLAIKKNPLFEVSDIEVRNKKISYTIDTIQWFQNTPGWKGNFFYLLIGADSLLDIGTWKEPEKILNQIKTLVVSRPGYDMECVDEVFRRRVTFIDTPYIGISSSEIRQRVHTNRSIRYWVPREVESYIYNKGLYR